MKQKIFKYGLLAGSVIVLIPVITSWFIGTGPETFAIGEIIGYSTMIVSLLLIFMAVNEYKQSQPERSVSFSKILMIGTGISAIAGVMFGIYNWVYVTYIAPEFVDQYYNYYIENIRSSGAPQTEIDSSIASLNEEKEMFMNPIVSFLAMFVSVFIVGLIISFFSAFTQSSKANDA